MAQGFILTLYCPDRVGIVARLARLMEQHDCFIMASRTVGDKKTGRHIEGIALLRAVKAHTEHRVFQNSGKTVVFAR